MTSKNYFKKYLIDEALNCSRIPLKTIIDEVNEFSKTKLFMDGYKKWALLNQKKSNTRRPKKVSDIFRSVFNA